MSYTLADSLGVISPRLHASADRYGGVVCAPSGLVDVNEFESELLKALVHWSLAGVRGVWFRVPLTESQWIAPLVRAGFSAHHTGGEDAAQYCLLNRWLPKDEPNKMPQFANSYIGVGGFVLSPSGELLVVTERYAFDGVPRYKLPGGMVDQNEHLEDAVVREVFEETGVRATFGGTFLLRHNTRYLHGCSDLYVVCALLADSTDPPIPDPGEVDDARWMPVPQFLADEHALPLNKQIAVHAIECAKGRLPFLTLRQTTVVTGDRSISFDTYAIRPMPPVAAAPAAPAKSTAVPFFAPASPAAAADAFRDREQPRGPFAAHVPAASVNLGLLIRSWVADQMPRS